MFQQIIAMGRLGQNAELKYVGVGGVAVSNFSLATTHHWTDRSGQKMEKTQWFRVNLWGKTAESLNQYLTKGKLILVTGRMESRTYTDKQGVQKESWEIVADEVKLTPQNTGAKPTTGHGEGPGRNEDADLAAAFGGEQAFTEDDIPF